MSNPNKAAGTAWEQAVVAAAHKAGLRAWPLARRGPSDPGDLVIVTPAGDHIVVEARCRERMSVHPELAEAVAQTEKADLPFLPMCTVIAWLRLALKEGNQRRSRVWRPVVVVGFDEFLYLIGGEE